MNKNYYQEDPQKQLVIVRQSQMERTIEMFQLMKVVPTDINQVIALHQILTNYVLTGEIDKTRSSNFNQWLKKQNSPTTSLDEVLEDFRTL
jgi:hypothetical protein